MNQHAGFHGFGSAGEAMDCPRKLRDWEFSEEIILFRQPIVPDFIFSACGQPLH
jgi:hypothetical protein